MEVILLENIPTLGKIGDIIWVKAGYARNFLIPGGKVVVANEKNRAEIEKRRAELEKKYEEILKQARDSQALIDGIVIEMNANAGVDGKLFGSVTAMEIAKALAKYSQVNVKKSAINLPDGPLRTIGEFDVKVELHNEVHANLKINVVNSNK